MNLEGLVPYIVSGAVSSIAAWFVFARKLTTRDEVEKMIQDRTRPIEDRNVRWEAVMEGVRTDLGALRVETARLTVLLDTRRPAE